MINKKYIKLEDNKMKKKSFLILNLVITMLICSALLLFSEWDKGVQCYNKKDYKCAETEFQQVIELNPEHYAGYYMLGLTYLDSKKINDAEKNLLLALKYAHKDYGTLFNLGRLYSQKNDYNKVIQYTTQSLAADKITPQQRGFSLKMRADAYFNTKQYDKAEKDIEEAMKLLPKDESLPCFYGINAYYLKNYDKAFHQLSKVYGKPNCSGIKNALMLMDAANQTKNYSKAIEVGEALVSHGTKDEKIISQLAVSYIAQSNYSKAVENLKKLPDNTFKLFNLAQIYVTLKDWIAAEQILKIWKQKEPKNPKCSELYGHVYFNTKRPYDALDSFIEAQNNAPASEKAHYQTLINDTRKYIKEILEGQVQQAVEHEKMESQRSPTTTTTEENKEVPKPDNSNKAPTGKKKG